MRLMERERGKWRERLGTKKESRELKRKRVRKENRKKR